MTAAYVTAGNNYMNDSRRNDTYRNDTYRNDTYRNGISRRARTSIIRRENELRRKKKIVVTIAAVITITLLLLGITGIHAFAGSSDRTETYEYYTAVTVEPGDTLWSLADDYMENSGMSKKAYVSKVKKLNNIPNGELHEGDTIVMMYYSTELK